jgi:hypothetical protein
MQSFVLNSAREVEWLALQLSIGKANFKTHYGRKDRRGGGDRSEERQRRIVSSY